MLDDEKLNDDQRRSRKGLPSLEAVLKELEEVKKAVEVRLPRLSYFPLQFNSLQSVEADRAVAEARELAERRKFEVERLVVAVAEAEVCSAPRLTLCVLLVTVFVRARHATGSLDSCTSFGYIHLSLLSILAYRRLVSKIPKSR